MDPLTPPTTSSISILRPPLVTDFDHFNNNNVDEAFLSMFNKSTGLIEAISITSISHTMVNTSSTSTTATVVPGSFNELFPLPCSKQADLSEERGYPSSYKGVMFTSSSGLAGGASLATYKDSFHATDTYEYGPSDFFTKSDTIALLSIPDNSPPKVKRAKSSLVRKRSRSKVSKGGSGSGAAEGRGSEIERLLKQSKSSSRQPSEKHSITTLSGGIETATGRLSSPTKTTITTTTTDLQQQQQQQVLRTTTGPPSTPQKKRDKKSTRSVRVKNTSATTNSVHHTHNISNNNINDIENNDNNKNGNKENVVQISNITTTTTTTTTNVPPPSLPSPPPPPLSPSPLPLALPPPPLPPSLPFTIIQEAKTFENLPTSVQEACIKSGLDPSERNINCDILWSVCSFLMRKHFPRKSISPTTTTTSKHKTFDDPKLVKATEHFVQKASNIPKFHELFKKMQYFTEGGHGKIFVATYKPKKQMVAIKKLPHFTQAQRYSNLCEVGHMVLCKHTSVVQHIATYEVVNEQKESELWVVTEYIEGGSLHNVTRNIVIEELQVACVARSVLLALKYLHGQNYAHRDLKPSNMMLSSKSVVKLVDFGLCAHFPTGTRTEIVGTPHYIPPEMTLNQPHTVSADIWSLGVSLLDLMTRGMEPYGKESKMMAMYRVATEGIAHILPSVVECSGLMTEFLKMCLKFEQSERASAQELLEHPWVNQENMDQAIHDLLHTVMITKSIDVLLK